jgi:hypothetical protein
LCGDLTPMKSQLDAIHCKTQTKQRKEPNHDNSSK